MLKRGSYLGKEILENLVSFPVLFLNLVMCRSRVSRLSSGIELNKI